MFAVSHGDKKIAQESCHEKVLKASLLGIRIVCLSQIWSVVYHTLKTRSWLEKRLAIWRQKTVGPSGLMLEMVASTCEDWITIIDLMKHQIRGRYSRRVGASGYCKLLLVHKITDLIMNLRSWKENRMI